MARPGFVRTNKLIRASPVGVRPSGRQAYVTNEGVDTLEIL